MTHMTPIAPSPDDDAFGTAVDAMLPVLGLSMEPEWRPQVVANLMAVSNAARLFLEFPLPDELEPAPRFEA